MTVRICRLVGAYNLEFSALTRWLNRYSTLFAVAFPLAPLFAWLNNCVELRSDAYKLCKVHRRPEYFTRQDIGAWRTVFETIAVGAVITNALLIGFVGSQMATWFDTSGYEAQNQEARKIDWRLWGVAVFIEHSILVLRFSIKTVVPQVPAWIPNAKMQMERDAKKTVRPLSDLSVCPRLGTGRICAAAAKSWKVASPGCGGPVVRRLPRKIARQRMQSERKRTSKTSKKPTGQTTCSRTAAGHYKRAKT